MTRTGGSKYRSASSAGRRPAARARERSRGVNPGLLLAGKAASGVVVSAIVVMGLLYLRLMFGPIALNFLVRPIETAITEELAGPRVQIERVALKLSDRGLIQFELRNVRVSDEAGETLVAAPSVTVSLSGKAMFRGRVAVESLDLMAARLVLLYADDGTLSLKFSPDAEAAQAEGPKLASKPQTSPTQMPHTPASLTEAEGLLGRIDLIKVLSEASARARRLEDASGYLRGIGLRSATVIIDNGKHKTTWQVPELDVDLDHRRTRSFIAGRARIESQDGPWELAFRSFERVSTKALKIQVSVQGLVPRSLARTFPHLLALEGFELPISADARLDLSDTGEVLGGKIVIEAAAGNVALPGPKATPMRIEGGHVDLTYHGPAGGFEIGASELTWGEGRIQLAGAIVPAAQREEAPRWSFDIKSTGGWISADPRAPMRLPIDQLSATGFLAPEQGRIVLEQFVVRAGGTEVSTQGELSDIGGAIQARLDGKIGAMSVGLFKTLWPSWLAPQTRSWAAQHLARGDVHGGTFKIVRGAPQPSGGWTPVTDGDRFSLALEGSNLELAIAKGWPSLEAPRGLLRIEGTAVELSVPEATIAAADGRKLSLKATFSIDLGQPLPRHGQLSIKASGPLSLALDMLEQAAPGILKEADVKLAGSDGKVDANLTIKVPVEPQPQLRDATVEGKLRISDARVPRAFGKLDVQGINLNVDLSVSAFEAKGKFLVGNVPATLTWQHVYGVPAEKQPPLRVAAVLYENERAELGLDVNDLVQGEVSVEATVAQDAKGERHVHLRVDLANAELTIEGLSWRKPVGRRAVFEFDVAKGTAYPVELHNVRLDGENVAIAGWMGAGEDFRVREYRFPQFSLDVVSNFEAHGKLRSDHVWEVTAKGPTYDGRELFKSFFFVPMEKHDRERPGLDVRAEFDTVLGYFETSARGVRLTMQKRANKVTQLDMRAGLAGGKQLEAVVRPPEPGRPRTLVAKSNDAGQVFKLVGFLPHAIGGDLNMEVNIEGRGPVERTGTLSAARFHLLGDVVSVDGSPSPGPGGRRRNVVREKIEFDSLRAPFSVGAGQFVLNDARLDGPMISATMSGRVDFRTRKVHVTGTFTPLAALNKIFSDVPLVGDIVTGPKREGVFAWNYAVQGGLENPQIVVNPMSGVAPGFTRELFPILPYEPSAPPRKAGKRDLGARASSSPVARPGAADDLFPTAPDVSDGWISEPDARKK